MRRTNVRVNCTFIERFLQRSTSPVPFFGQEGRLLSASRQSSFIAFCYPPSPPPVLTQLPSHCSFPFPPCHIEQPPRRNTPPLKRLVPPVSISAHFVCWPFPPARLCRCRRASVWLHRCTTVQLARLKFLQSTPFLFSFPFAPILFPPPFYGFFRS